MQPWPATNPSQVSIHAPAGGATAFLCAGYSGSTKFQFTLPRGERRMTRARYWALRLVSIHAPAGGATAKTLPAPIAPCVFQFTLPRGERHHLIVFVISRVAFQFTLPRGERRLWRSRIRRRSLFQFTLPRGERPPPFGDSATMRQFQFTLPRGERRRLLTATTRAIGGFNSRSRGGSDLAKKGVQQIRPKFQFTLPRGERLPSERAPLAPCDVSIHAPAGGATWSP